LAFNEVDFPDENRTASQEETNFVFFPFFACIFQVSDILLPAAFGVIKRRSLSLHPLCYPLSPAAEKAEGRKITLPPPLSAYEWVARRMTAEIARDTQKKKVPF